MAMVMAGMECVSLAGFVMFAHYVDDVCCP